MQSPIRIKLKQNEWNGMEWNGKYLMPSAIRTKLKQNEWNGMDLLSKWTVLKGVQDSVHCTLYKDLVGRPLTTKEGSISCVQQRHSVVSFIFISARL